MPLIKELVQVKPLILVTNDDGINSAGVLALRRAMASLGEAVLLAPDRNWSAAGHNRTMDRPLRVTKVKTDDGGEGLASDGTPSDCVNLAVIGILERKPDLVVSGINKGPNLGDDITYSGTVAAAMEGCLAGIPSIAFSLNSYVEWDFRYAASFAFKLSREVLRNGLPPKVFLNVNVPAVSESEITGVAVTRLGTRAYQNSLVKRIDPFGRPYYWLGGEFPGSVLEAGTDVSAVRQGMVSVTPLHMDMTDEPSIETLKQWHLEL